MTVVLVSRYVSPLASQFPDGAGPGNRYRRFVSEPIPGPAGISVLTSGGLITSTTGLAPGFLFCRCLLPHSTSTERTASAWRSWSQSPLPDCAETYHEPSRMTTGPNSHTANPKAAGYTALTRRCPNVHSPRLCTVASPKCLARHWRPAHGKRHLSHLPV